MSNPQSIFRHFTFLPFFMTGVFCFLEKLLTYSLIQEKSQLLENAFKNYFSFMGIMVALKLITIIFAKKSRQALPQDAFIFKAEPTASSKIKQAIIHLCKLIFCYTIIFGCFQFVFTLGFHLPRNSPQDILINSSISQTPSRHLDQIVIEPSEIQQDLIEPEKLISSPDLNPGEILGSFNPGKTLSLDLLISKDSKTLYTLMNNSLVIFDISNPKKPSKLGLLEEIFNGFLLLSPDQDLLFLLATSKLQVFNITNKTSPSEIAQKRFKTSILNDFSMVISSDGKTLYTIEPSSFRIWNVSDPKVPSVIYEEILESGWSGSIAISKNDTRLAVGLEDGFKILSVENPRRPIVLAFEEYVGYVYSLAFSRDETKLLLGVKNDLYHKINVFDFELAIFDITNLASPTMLVSQQLNKEASYGKLWFHANEKYAFFNTKREFKMINILDGEQTTLFSTSSDVPALPFTTSPSNKINVVYFSGRINIMKFHIDMTSKSFLHFKQSALRVIDEVDFERRRVMEISKDGKNLFLMRMNTTTNTSFAEIIPYERKSRASFEKMNSSSRLEARVYDDLNDGNRWIFIAGKNVSVIDYIPDLGSNLFLLNMTNKNKIYQVANIKFQSFYQQISAVALTHDDKSLIFVNHTDDSQYRRSKTPNLNIMTWNQKEQKLIPSLANLDMPFIPCSPFSLMKTNRDDSLLFYVNCDMEIYNIANPSATTLESSQRLNISQAYAFTLSKDEKILFLLGSDSPSSNQKLLIFNVSDPKSPHLLSSLLFEQISSSTESLELNLDETILFIGFLDGILMVDVQALAQPVLFGFNYFLDQMYTPRFIDNATMLYTSSFKGVTAYDFSSQYILYFKNSEFKIGGSYSVLLNVLKLNKNLKFDFMAKEHRFLKVTLLEQSSTSYTALPNWITFDKEKSLLTL